MFELLSFDETDIEGDEQCGNQKHQRGVKPEPFLTLTAFVWRICALLDGLSEAVFINGIAPADAQIRNTD